MLRTSETWVLEGMVDVGRDPLRMMQMGMESLAERALLTPYSLATRRGDERDCATL